MELSERKCSVPSADVPTSITHLKRLACLVAVAACAYVATVFAVACFQRNLADQRSEFDLAYVANDFEASFDDMVSYGLRQKAVFVRDHLGSAGRVVDRDQIRRLAADIDLDEVNVVRTDGSIAASTDDDVLKDGCMRGAAVSFMVLTNADVDVYSEPFRPGAANPNCVRKYLGIPFPDGSGFVQVGCDLEKVVETFESGVGLILSHWTFGKDDSGFFFFAHRTNDDYCVTQDTFDEGEYVGAWLKRDLNVKIDERLRAAPHTFDFRENGAFFTGRSFRSSYDGKDYAFRLRPMLDRLLVAVMPLWPNRTDTMRTTLLVAVLLLALFGAFGALLARIAIAGRKLSAMRAAEDKRNAEDLATAHSIQRTAVPVIFPPYPRDLKMDVYASMEPARDVGGDFYDFYYVGTNRFAVVVADVSGKGVPAAMFMMKAKTLLKSCVLSMNDLAEAVAETNARLCEGNEAGMFVTCWVGVLDETTGELVYVNAGHNAPYVRHSDGGLEMLDAVSGLFLAALENVTYKVQRARLEPGDLLFLYTDGVTEANNVMHEMFGETRLEEVLCGERGRGLQRFNPKAPKLPPPKDVCTFVRNAVDAFAGAAAQFDDITMLALRYRGQPETFEMSQPAVMDFMPKLQAFVEEKLVAADCPQEAKADVLVALDEVLTNVCQYSGSPIVSLHVEIARDPKAVRVTVIDSGSPWNPLEHLDPDITLSADDREIGGLGILMVKKLMDDVSYAHVSGQNRFAFRKVFG